MGWLYMECKEPFDFQKINPITMEFVMCILLKGSITM